MIPRHVFDEQVLPFCDDLDIMMVNHGRDYIPMRDVRGGKAASRGYLSIFAVVV